MNRWRPWTGIAAIRHLRAVRIRLRMRLIESSSPCYLLLSCWLPLSPEFGRSTYQASQALSEFTGRGSPVFLHLLRATGTRHMCLTITRKRHRHGLIARKESRAAWKVGAMAVKNVLRRARVTCYSASAASHWSSWQDTATQRAANSCPQSEFVHGRLRESPEKTLRRLVRTQGVMVPLDLEHWDATLTEIRRLRLQSQQR